MRNYPIVMALLCLSGCSSFEPRDNPWADVEQIPETAPTPAHILPEFPEFGTSADGLITITPAEGRDLLLLIEASEGNVEILENHAAQIVELRVSHNALARAGQHEYELAELRAQIIDEERRARIWDQITSWVIIAILGVAVVSD